MQGPLCRGWHIVANNVGGACLLGDSVSRSGKGMRSRRARGARAHADGPEQERVCRLGVRRFGGYLSTRSITMLSKQSVATRRVRIREQVVGAPRRCTRYSLGNWRLPGFAEFLCLNVPTAQRLQTQAASQPSGKINGQNIPHGPVYFAGSAGYNSTLGRTGEAASHTGLGIEPLG
ncbi:hypothetical protein D3C71_1650650 [compost metagenome]